MAQKIIFRKQISIYYDVITHIICFNTHIFTDIDICVYSPVFNSIGTFQSFQNNFIAIQWKYFWRNGIVVWLGIYESYDGSCLGVKIQISMCFNSLNWRQTLWLASKLWFLFFSLIFKCIQINKKKTADIYLNNPKTNRFSFI